MASRGRTDIETATQAILQLLEHRRDQKTICPSEAARLIAGEGDFRVLMDVVRDAAAELVEQGRVEVVQHGQVVDLDEARGPIRLRARREPS